MIATGVLVDSRIFELKMSVQIAQVVDISHQLHPHLARWLTLLVLDPQYIEDLLEDAKKVHVSLVGLHVSGRRACVPGRIFASACDRVFRDIEYLHWYLDPRISRNDYRLCEEEKLVCRHLLTRRRSGYSL